MKKYFIMFLMLFIFCSCAAGPVYMAKNESESIKRMYGDAKSQELFNKNTDLFKDIYLRYNASHINFYNEGIGITTLNDDKNNTTPLSHGLYQTSGNIFRRKHDKTGTTFFLRTPGSATISEAYEKQRPGQEMVLKDLPSVFTGP